MPADPVVNPVRLAQLRRRAFSQFRASARADGFYAEYLALPTASRKVVFSTYFIMYLVCLVPDDA